VLPEKLHKKLSARKDQNSLRSLPESNNLVDFSSNDYLGVVNHNSLARVIQTQTRRTLKDFSKGNSGATGSRLLTGNHILYEKLEAVVSRFHESESALIFNSGYTANLGFFQSVPQRGDIILYDELAHASIRDGLKMSDAKAYKFEHNSLHHLSQLLKKHSFSSLPLGEMSAGQRGTLGEMPAGQRGTLGEMHTGQRGNSIDLYVVTESVFSMDGDSPDLVAIAQLCKQYNAKFVVDEAHAVGVLGIQGQGLVQLYGIQKLVFARLVTFGKAAGAHGAAILGSNDLKEYLINFARPFIYTTALPPHTIATILSFYTIIEEMKVSHMIENVRRLKKNINIFRSHIPRVRMDNYFVSSVSAIQCAIIPGVDRIKTLSRKLKEKGYDLKPILPPTVPEGTERLRFCLHSYNTKEQIHEVLEILQEELT
jgi:8-amino-7-oxononanoate synthase